MRLVFLNTHTHASSGPRRTPFGAALLLGALLLLSGCTALVLPESWAGLTVDGALTDGRYDARYIYVAYRDVVFRIDLTRDAVGRVLEPNQRSTDRFVDWAARSNNNGQMFAAPALEKREEGVRVYVGSYNHAVYAFAPDSGVRNAPLPSWAAPIGTEKVIAEALVHGDRVYVGQGDKGIKAFSTATGALLASFDGTSFGVWSAPVLDEARNAIYFGAMDRHVYALDADTLELLWRVEVGGAVAASPLLHEGVLYFGTLTSELIAVDAHRESRMAITNQSDRILRRYKAEGWIWSTPTLVDGTLYFGDLRGYVHAVDAATFTPRWKAHDPERRGGIRGRVAVVDGRVIAGSESKHLRAYNAESGALVWTSSPAEAERILGDVVVVGDMVITTTKSEERLVVAYDLLSGGRLWSVRKPSQDDVNRLAQAPR
jgi:outer membrane protein assembly factor BamB